MYRDERLPESPIQLFQGLAWCRASIPPSGCIQAALSGPFSDNEVIERIITSTEGTPRPLLSVLNSVAE